MQSTIDIEKPLKQDTLLVFVREKRFYSIELEAGSVIKQHIDCNPETIRVEVALTGEVLYDASTINNT